MGHAAPGNASMQMDHSMHGASGANAMVSHPASETGNPAVDMQTMTPSRALDDPGIGLRGNGRKVLTYADLKSAFDDPDPREPSRTVELHLTGNMERYVWGFDGIRFSDAEPVRLNYRSEEHTSELQSLMRISYAVFCLKKKIKKKNNIKRN